MHPYPMTATETEAAGASLEDTVTVPGTGATPVVQAEAATPGVAVAPGVTVIAQEPDAAKEVPQVVDTVVPTGIPAAATDKLAAGTVPVF